MGNLKIKDFKIIEHPIKYEGSNSLFLYGQTIVEGKEINIIADVEINWYYSTNSGSYYSPSFTNCCIIIIVKPLKNY